ncbi:MAG: ABC transporter ATP-binding protein [Bifidobacteriaceae bacterium]|jgi:branched-chain amino acid transport system ATP-binding protein|nr:ABC transporter ATP-binding protein [Bifidobacteriaceae bacterium]
MNEVLSVSDLIVKYGNVEAIHGISLTIDQSELITICGANGAGKSTLLKTIAGLIRPAAGTIQFLDQDIAGKKPEDVHKLGVALVPEAREIFPSLTVAENLRVGVFGQYHAKQYAEDLEDMFTLFPILKTRYQQAGGLLSGGEQQMLAIARGLVSRPQLLMLDEPTLGLSPTYVDQIFDLITHLKQRKITILLVEQNANRAIEISDRAYLIKNGSVEFNGNADEMQSKIDLESIYLGG